MVIRQAVRMRTVPWWLLLLEGIALIILGILFLTNPASTAVTAVTVLGLYWLISGIFGIIGIFINSHNWLWKLILGVIGIIAGVLILQHPITATFTVGAALVLWMGILGLIIGIMNIIRAFTGEGWGVGILGVISVILGIVLLANWAGVTISLAWTLGILGLIGGVITIINAFRARGIQKDMEAGTDELTNRMRATSAKVDAAATAAGAAGVAAAGRAADATGDAVGDAADAVGDAVDAVGYAANDEEGLRLDAAIPEHVFLECPFDLAVSVRLPGTSALVVEELEHVKSGKVRVEWPDTRDFVDLRFLVRAPDFRISGQPFQLIRLHLGKNSPVAYFSLTPLRTGTLPIIVTVYQAFLTLGTTRTTAEVLEHRVAGEVHTLVQSGTLRRPSDTSEDIIVAQTLYSLLVRGFSLDEMKELCFELDVDLDSMPGTTRKSKASELVGFVRRRRRVDELVDLIIVKRPNWLELLGEV